MSKEDTENILKLNTGFTPKVIQRGDLKLPFRLENFHGVLMEVSYNEFLDHTGTERKGYQWECKGLDGSSYLSTEYGEAVDGYGLFKNLEDCLTSLLSFCYRTALEERKGREKYQKMREAMDTVLKMMGR